MTKVLLPDTMDENPATEQAAQTELKLALIASRRSVGIYPIFLKHLLAGLADESIPVTLVVPPRCDLTIVTPPGIELLRHPVLELPLTGRLNRNILLEQLQAASVNLLHCLGASQTALTRWLSKQLGVPYIVTVDSLPSQIRRLALSPKRCARVVVPAKSIATDCATVYPKFTGRIECVSAGIFVGDSPICFSEADRTAGIVIAHRLDDVSELENVLGALRRFAIDGREFVAALLGAGRQEKQVFKRLGELGMLQMTTIIPRTDSHAQALAAGDIFILPRPQQSFNPLLLEAMSIGSVVAAPKGGVDDLIIENQTAAVFDPDDPLSIYNCLRTLLDGKDQARQLAKQAQQYLRENHKVSTMIDSITRVYHDAVEQSER